MTPTKAIMTVALLGAGLAAAGLALNGNELGGACPLTASAGSCCPASGECAEGAKACPVDLTAKGATAAYRVSGLSCEDCESKLTQLLGKVEGVAESSVCAKTGLAKVSYDPAVTKKEKLLAAIQSAGFRMEGEVVELKVQGLDCESCSGTVSKALTALPGVKGQEVCVESKLAKVTFDPAKTSRELIVAAIDKTGFKVAP